MKYEGHCQSHIRLYATNCHLVFYCLLRILCFLARVSHIIRQSKNHRYNVVDSKALKNLAPDIPNAIGKSLKASRNTCLIVK